MIRPVKFNFDLHMPIVTEWWKAHDWPAVEVDTLPETGCIVFNGESPVCAGFLYKTDSAACWIEWVISDPKSDKEVRGKCLDAMMQLLVSIGEALGYRITVGYLTHPSLIERYQKHGFKITDKNVSILMRVRED